MSRRGPTRRDRLVALAEQLAEAHGLAGAVVGYVPDGDPRAVRLLDTLFDALAELERLAGPQPAGRRTATGKTARGGVAPSA